MPSSWEIVIPDYKLPSLDVLLKTHAKRRGKVKQGLADLLAAYAAQQGATPPRPAPDTVRRVDLHITRKYGPSGRLDEDNCWKIVLDSLGPKRLGWIVDDSPAFLERGGVVQDVGLQDVTRVTIADVTRKPCAGCGRKVLVTAAVPALHFCRPCSDRAMSHLYGLAGKPPLPAALFQKT